MTRLGRLPDARRVLRFAALCGAILASAAHAEADSSVRVQRGITYSEPDGVTLKLDAYLPPDADTPRPAVLVVHGGAWCAGTRRQLWNYAGELAEAGIAAFAIEYRLAPAHRWPAQIDDCRAALAWVHEHAKDYNVDSTRVGAFGYSAGGQLVALLGTTETADAATDVRCVAAGGAPCEFRTMDPENPLLAYWLGGTRKEFPDLYAAASPVAFVNAEAPPMFFFHGEDDTLVPRQSAIAMVDALKGAGAKAELLLMPGHGHISALRNPQSVTSVVEFFKAQLINEPTATR